VTSPGGVSLPVVALFLLTFALALPTADNSQAPGPRIPVVQDWTHRHVVFGGGGSLEARIAAARNPRAVQQWLIRQQAWLQAQKDGGNNGLHLGQAKKQVDWAVSLGSTGGVSPTMYPAKYSFSVTTASCDDFMVFPVNAGGAGKASIVILDSLYSGGSTATAGMCNTGNTTPGANGPYNSGGTYEARVWAAYTLPNPVTTSPVLSLDGTKVLVVDTVCNLHQITIPSDHSTTYGTVASPATPTKTSASLGGAACTKSSPFVDYSTGAAYVGNDSGVLYKIPNAFGTPGTPTSGTVDSGHALLSPVVDSDLQRVLVTTTYGKLCLVNATNLTVVGSCAQPGAEGAVSVITDPPLVDSTNVRVYVFGNSEAGSPIPFVRQYKYSAIALTPLRLFQNNTMAASFGIHVGAFDDPYYSDTPTNGYLYFAAPKTSSRTELFKIAFDSPLELKTSQNSSMWLCSTICETSPLTEFKSGTTERIFYSVLSTGTVGSATTGLALTTAATTYPGGTSGIIVDNAVFPLQQASSIYFGTLGTGACGTGNYCAVKLTQSGLQ